MSKQVDDGGLAFPFTAQGVGGETNEAYPGMTLRDWFAGQALAGWLSSCDPSECANPRDSSQVSYEMADAMIKARGESND